MSMPAADQFLMSGGVTSAKFPTPGTTVAGTITEEPEVQQQREYGGAQTPKFWPDGKPMLQLRVKLQTTERDPSDPEDEGIRAVYVKGLMQKAVQAAVREAGAKGLAVGGHLSITYTADGERKGGNNPPKLYTAAYTVPDPLAQASGTSAPGAGGSGEAPTGVDPSVWATLNDEQKAAVRASAQAQPPF